MLKEKLIRNLLMVLIAGLGFAVFIPATEKEVDLNGTWLLEPAQNDSGQHQRREGRTGGSPGLRGIIPGIGGYPGGQYPGGGYPGTGYPSGRRAGGYPRGRDGNDGGNGEGMPGDSIKDLTLRIVQSDNEVQTTRSYTVNGEDKTVSQKFALDGSQNTNPASNGRGEFKSTSIWKNDRLTNTGTQTMTMRDQSYDITLKEEYSLSKDGKTLTIKTTRTTPRGETNNKQVFRKQESDSSESSPS